MIPKIEITSRCIHCDFCRIVCPEDSIVFVNGIYTAEEWSCTLCQICAQICPVDCIKIIDI